MPKIVENRLTARTVAALKRPGFHIDGLGLYLRIDGGRRLWVFRFTWGGKQTWHTIGSERDISLADAREAARKLRLLVKSGVNPNEARRTAKAAALVEEGRTFEAVARQYVTSHQAGWRSAKHGADVLNSLAIHAFAIIGSKPVADIGVADVLAVLEPIWRTKAETAARVRGRLEAVLGFATARHWRSGPNPAQWKGGLSHLLPPRSKVATVEHFPALPYAELPAVMAALAKVDTVASRCAMFNLFTAARPGNVRAATWAEIDLDAAVWTIPGAKMKTGRTHRIPLAPPALFILGALRLLRRPDDLVFPGARAGRSISDVAASSAFHSAGGLGFTIHGTARSSFRDWASEQTAFPEALAETALAHVAGDATVTAYARSDLLEKRRALMAAWAVFLTTPTRSGEIISIGQIRK
jgi:integrase